MNCPECGGELIQEGKKEQCEFCSFYMVKESEGDRLVRLGFMDKQIDLPVLKEYWLNNIFDELPHYGNRNFKTNRELI